MIFRVQRKKQFSPPFAKYFLAKMGNAWIYFVAFLLFCSIGNPAQAQFTSGSNTPVCIGGTLNLTCGFSGGCPGATYKWTGPAGSGFVDFTQNPSIASVTTAYAGVYSIQAVCSGVTYNQTVTVVINPAIGNIVVTHPACDDVSPVITLTIDNIGGATYSWTTTGSNTITSPTTYQATVPSDFNSAGTYSVTVTAAGCTATVTTTILDSDIMNFVTGVNLGADAFISNYGGATQTSRNFVFTGDFDFTCTQTVNASLTFTSCTLYMQPNTQINVGHSGGGCAKKTLRINDTDVIECYSWDGIVLVGDGSSAPGSAHTVLVLNTSLVRGSAGTGIDVSNGGYLQVDNSTLDAHATQHIDLSTFTGDTQSRLDVNYSTFTGIISSGYQGIGINVTDVVTLNIDGCAGGACSLSSFNLFYQLEYGIKISASTPTGVLGHTIVRNHFNAIEEKAIVAVGNDNTNSRINIGSNSTTPGAADLNVFDGIGGSYTGNTGFFVFAIDLYAYNRVYVNRNYFDAVNSGVWVQNATKLREIYVNDNEMYFRKLGVYIKNCQPPTSTSPHFCQVQRDSLRFWMDNSITITVGAVAYENNTYLKSTTEDNTIRTIGLFSTYPYSNVSMVGIGYNGENYPAARVRGNLIYFEEGFSIGLCTGVSYIGNLYLGSLLVAKNAGGTTNRIVRAHWGVDIGNDCIVSIDQNEIYPTDETPALGGFIAGVNLYGTSRYKVTDNTIEGKIALVTSGTPNYGISTVQPTVSFSREITCNDVRKFNQSLHFDAGQPSPIVVARNVMEDADAGMFIKNMTTGVGLGSQSGSSTSYDNEWLTNGSSFATSHIHQQACTITAATFYLLNPSGTDYYPGTFLNTSSNASFAAYTGTNTSADYDCDGAGPGASLVAPGGDFDDGFTEENRADIEAALALIGGGIEPPTMTDADFNPPNWEEYLSSEEEIEPVAPPFRNPENLTAAATLLQSLTPQTDVEETKIAAVLLWISYEQNGGLNGGEYTQLQTLASLCSYTHGTGVFDARALLARITRMIPAHTESCNGPAENGARLAKTEKTTPTEITVYPNPAKENIVLSITGTTDVKVEVYGIDGRLVQNFTLTPGTHNIPAWSPGFYNLRFLNGDRLLNTQKVQILD